MNADEIRYVEQPHTKLVLEILQAQLEILKALSQPMLVIPEHKPTVLSMNQSINNNGNY